jgi:quercetin dioxygenase-like cupin family protein
MSGKEFQKALQSIVESERRAVIWVDEPVLGPDSLPSFESLVPPLLAAGGTFPDFRLSKAGNRPAGLPRADQISLLSRPAVDLAELLARMKTGWTLVVDGVQQFDPTVGDLCAEVAERLRIEPFATVYLSATEQEAIGLHEDDHAVIVIQFEGTKDWTIERDGRIERFRLSPGQMIYLPAGVPHTASAVGGLSGHLTLAVSPPALSLWMERIAAGDSPALRSPFGSIGDPSEKTVSEAAEAMSSLLRDHASGAHREIARLYHRSSSRQQGTFTRLLRRLDV